VIENQTRIGNSIRQFDPPFQHPLGHASVTIGHRILSVTAVPDNSNEQVEARLLAWAERVPARDQLHQKLLKSQEPVENALTKFLLDHFLIGRDDARVQRLCHRPYAAQFFHVPHSEAGGLALTPSATRAGAINDAKHAGANPIAIRNAANHANIATTDRYLREREADANRVIVLRKTSAKQP